MKHLVVFGTGGHSKVLIDIAEKTKQFEILGLFDDSSNAPSNVMGYPVLGSKEDLLALAKKEKNLCAVVAIGKNSVRREIAQWMRAQGIKMETLIHPSAIIAREVNIGDGTVVMAGVVVNSATSIGSDVILNTRCSVDHDCVIGNGTHLGPGVSLCGGVKIGEEVLLGVGAQAIPGVSIASFTIVGAGSTVIRNIEEKSTVVGSPAIPVR